MKLAVFALTLCGVATSLVAVAGAAQLLSPEAVVEWVESAFSAAPTPIVPAALLPHRPAVVVAPPPAEPEHCAEGMVEIEHEGQQYCIDRYEASVVGRAAPHRAWPGNLRVFGHEASLKAQSRVGVKPQGFINGRQAALMCENAGKRLCSSSEWLRACTGPERQTYPYGSQRKANVCNDRFKGFSDHPVVRLFQKFAPPGTPQKQMWWPRWMSDSRLHELPYTVTPTGQKEDCESPDGTFDMVGNLHEWVSDEGGAFRGGFFMDTQQNGEGCNYVTRAHTRSYYDYSTGFRCCSDLP